MPPTVTTFCCAVAVPTRHSAAVAPAATPITTAHLLLIVLPPLLLRTELVREWPDPEIISDIAPQPVQPFRLHYQEKNDQNAEQGQPQVGDRVLQVLLREQQPAVILKKPASDNRQQGNEDGAENRAENRAEPADDHHRQIIDRHGDLELLVIGDTKVVGVKHAGDAGVKRRNRERPQLVAENVDADDLGGDVLVADRDKG